MPAETSLWIWPFELEEKIGEGGMGVVYRGRYVKNDLRVAVKLLPQDVADEIILARFEREVEILKTLRHPNIVHSFGGVCEDKRRFYAMELVDGGSLESLLKSRGGSLPWERVVEYGLQMCAALQYAHERGIVHRDVKPANFLMTKAGKLKLSDFGLAIVTSGHKLTASGKTVGSFRYMAPEQVRGRPEPVPQTDLYALGCVLFQMVVGEPPFDANNAAELLSRHLSEEPRRVSQLVPECPASLDALIDSLLSKRIEDRPTSAANVAASLQSVSLTSFAGQPSSKSLAGEKRPPAKAAMPSPRRETKTVAGAPFTLMIVLAVAAFALGLLSVSLWNRNRELRQAEDLWIEAFHSNDRPTRENAAIALGKLSVKSDRAFAALKAGLESTDDAQRVAAITGLGYSGSKGRTLVSRLHGLQKSADSQHVRIAAGTARQKILESEETGGSSWLGWTLFLLLLCAIGAGGYIIYRRRANA